MPYTTYRSRRWRACKQPESDDIVALRCKLNACLNVEAKQGAARRLHRAKRTWHRFCLRRVVLLDLKEHPEDKRKNYQLDYLVSDDGSRGADKDKWPFIAQTCYISLYADESWQEQLGRLEALTRQLEQRHLLRQYFRIRWPTFVAASNRLQPGKQAGGDRIVVEMLRELGWDTLQLLHNLFEQRLHDHSSKDIANWEQFLLDCIPKVAKVVTLRVLRTKVELLSFP